MRATAVLPAILLSGCVSLSAQGAMYHLDPPASYLPCAEAMLRTATIVYLPVSWVRSECGSDAWSCIKAGAIVEAEGLSPELRHHVEIHEAAHLCGWPADHPGGVVVEVRG